MTGDVIRIIRALYGLSQRELAERLEISDMYLSYIERGERALTSRIAEQIRSELELTDEQVRELSELSRSMNRGKVLGNIPRPKH